MNKRSILFFAVLVFLFLAFRLKDLDALPMWHWDEGVNLNIAWNLSLGRARLFMMHYPFMPHPPLYFLFGSVFVRFFGASLLPLRLFSVLLGLLSLAYLFLVGRRAGGLRLAFLSALLFALYPGAVYWGRMAYANQLLSLLWISALYYYLKAGRWVYLSAFLAGLAFITEYTGVGVVASILYLTYRRDKAKLPLTLILCATPITVSSLTILLTQPSLFFGETQSSFSWHILGSSGMFFSILTVVYLVLLRIFRVKLRNLLDLWRDVVVYDIEFMFEDKAKTVLRQNPLLILLPFYVYLAYIYPLRLSDEVLFFGMDFFWLGLLGLMFLRKNRSIILAFFTPLFFILFFIGRSDHMLIPLYPFFALGLASLLVGFVEHAPAFTNDLKSWRYWPHFLILLLFLPVAKLLYSDYMSFVAVEDLSPEAVSDYVMASAYVNKNTKPGDVVIGNSNMFRFISSQHYTILTQSLAAAGRPVIYYQKEFDQKRMAFNGSYKRAKYLMLHPATFEWLENQSQADVSSELQSWPVEFNTTFFSVYRNPNLEY